MTQALTKQQNTDGMEDLDSSDILIPRVSIQQPTSKGDADPGLLVCNLGAEPRKSILVVPLKITKGRVLFGETIGDELRCKSDDGLLPSTTIATPQSNCCAQRNGTRIVPTCQQAIWDNGQRPQCKEVKKIVFLDAETLQLFVMDFKGSALAAPKSLTTMAFTLQRGLYAVKAELSTEKVKGAKGNYYIPVFKNVEACDEQLYKSAQDAYKSIANKPSVDANDEVPF
jgi:hypothetical protein